MNEIKNKKIYTRVDFDWNEDTQQYEPGYEEFYNYNGPMAYLVANPNPPEQSSVPSIAIPAGGANTKIPLNVGNIFGGAMGDDVFLDTSKVTTGYFTGGGGTLDNSTIYTMSLADSNEAYYFNVAQTHPLSSSATTQFSVAYGHVGGSGSNTNGGNIEGPSEAIYRQWAGTLLAESEISGGFRISTNEGLDPTNKKLSTRDPDIYVLVGKRSLYKDRINKKNWTMVLTGSTSANTNAGAAPLYLTDDSNTRTAVATVAGPRYNIVSGSDGVPLGNGAADKVYGWFYPNVGAMIFSATELSASIPGTVVGTSMTASFDSVSSGISTNASFASCSGFAPNLDANGNANNALRFVNCLQKDGAYIKLRSEEDQVSVSYFCRAKANVMNFSNNPTFVSGSSNEIRHKNMWGNPTVYISGVGLYGTDGQLVAIGKLSTPLIKNFGSEATIKVKLTY